MTREEFEVYLSHFNNKRYEAATSYFAPDVTLEFCTTPGGDPGDARTLHGVQAFIAQYQSLHANVHEVVELRDFIPGEDLIAAEMYTEFHALNDAPDFPRRPLKKGESMVMTNWVIYNLEAGKMKRIRIAHFRMHDSKTAKYAPGSLGN